MDGYYYFGKPTASYWKFIKLNLHDGRPYHIETSPMISKANQWTSFYMIRKSTEVHHVRVKYFDLECKSV